MMTIKYFLLYCIKFSLGSVRKPRIVGGELVTNRSDYPYIVSIQENGYHGCGGSIIHARLILTAAHCCYTSSNQLSDPKQILIQAGDLIVESTTNATRLRTVDEFFIHPLYNPINSENDIAIIKILGDLLPWNDYIRPIPLNSAKPTNGTCIVSGWGVTKFKNNYINCLLRSVNVSIVENALCEEEDIYTGLILEGMLCAGNPGKDACQGDSGGPLVCGSEKLLTGIVAWGTDCGLYPGVYTSVAKYTSWINKYVNTTHIEANISTTVFPIISTSPSSHFTSSGNTSATANPTRSPKSSSNNCNSSENITATAFNNNITALILLITQTLIFLSIN